ncbi:MULTISPECIES: hypothetical protein [unclassified Streptomyces]|uniref:hypothetical protein n=1 Tax=unclassified Streptomyces TaxID=2593676 RepID=UPI003D74C55D
MSRPTASRPALRVAVFGVLATVLGYALFATWLGWHEHRYREARADATATADGLVVEDGIGDDGDIRVRWTDTAGLPHVQRFTVYDTGRYTEGEHFGVAYDPTRPDPRGFPADPEETSAEDDLEVPAMLAAPVAAALCAVWAWRGLRFRRTARLDPAHPMTATVHQGDRAVRVWRGTTTWLSLTEPGDTRSSWQRVMWHPALDDCTGETPVTVRRSRRAVVQLPDGTRLVPLGRLRGRPSGDVLLDDWAAARADLRDAFVLPDRLRAAPWWLPGARVAAVGAALGVLMGCLTGGGTLTATVGFALAVSTLLTALWALAAPQP